MTLVLTVGVVVSVGYVTYEIRGIAPIESFPARLGAVVVLVFVVSATGIWGAAKVLAMTATIGGTAALDHGGLPGVAVVGGGGDGERGDPHRAGVLPVASDAWRCRRRSPPCGRPVTSTWPTRSTSDFADDRVVDLVGLVRGPADCGPRLGQPE